jgi:ElaB/YqjD/DUF883 family membrane-anchored ribosome-binding protein
MPTRNGDELTGFREAKARLADDLRLVAQDAEELIKAGGGELAERTKEVRARLKVALDDAKQTCARLEEQAGVGIQKADKAVRENPYRAIGIAVGLGFLAGFLLKRRS